MTDDKVVVVSAVGHHSIETMPKFWKYGPGTRVTMPVDRDLAGPVWTETV